MDVYHPSESSIIQIAHGTFKGTSSAQDRNLVHILDCATCNEKYEAAQKTKPASKANKNGLFGRFRHN